MATDRILISLGIACLAAVAFGFITGVASVLPVAAVATLCGQGSPDDSFARHG